MPNPAEIAAKLTKAQARLLPALPSDPAKATHFWNGEYRQYPGALRTYRVLSRKGLADTFGAVTPLGLAVRAHLENNNDRS